MRDNRESFAREQGEFWRHERCTALLHRFFAPARLDREIADRFGNPLKPREWRLAPLPVIDEVVARIQDGSIVDYEYNPASASLRVRAAI
jgi:hypothetical protein